MLKSARFTTSSWFASPCRKKKLSTWSAASALPATSVTPAPAIVARYRPSGRIASGWPGNVKVAMLIEPSYASAIVAGSTVAPLVRFSSSRSAVDSVGKTFSLNRTAKRCDVSNRKFDPGAVGAVASMVIASGADAGDCAWPGTVCVAVIVCAASLKVNEPFVVTVVVAPPAVALPISVPSAKIFTSAPGTVDPIVNWSALAGEPLLKRVIPSVCDTPVSKPAASAGAAVTGEGSIAVSKKPSTAAITALRLAAVVIVSNGKPRYTTFSPAGPVYWVAAPLPEPPTYVIAVVDPPNALRRSAKSTS